MKKLICLILLILPLCACERYNISTSLFIASIGIEQKDEENYQGYFYLPLSSDVGKAENTENKGKGEFAKVMGKSVADLFKNIKATTSLDINFRHVSSIVLNTELLTPDFLKELSDYIKYSHSIDFNCHLFATDEKMEDIYDFQNPNQESVLHSILVSTSEAKGVFLVATPPHFLEFVSKFYADRSIILPSLDVEEIWQVDGEKVKNSYFQSAVYYYKSNTKKVIKNPASPYVRSTKKIDDLIEGQSITFEPYNFKVDLENNVKIKVETRYLPLTSQFQLTEDEIKEYIVNHIKKYLDEYKELDPLDLNYFNQIKDKNYSYEDVDIEINFQKN